MIEIRKVAGHEDFERCVDLQKLVWGFSDRDVYPSRLFVVAQTHGGCVLGAYNEEGELIGFVMSIASIHHGRLGQHSCMLAVLPEYQNQGVGWRLKLAQRDEALARGIKVITWTFDPLEARNAHLNLNKLGVIVRTYLEDHYTPSSSLLHSGLGTDRFLAEWWIDSPHVRQVLEEGGRSSKEDDRLLEGVEKINAVSYNQAGLLISSQPDLTLTGERLTFEIPADIQKIRDCDFDLARRWRQQSRAAFKFYLDRGYAVTHLLVKREPIGSFDRRVFYMLEKGWRDEG